MYTLQWVYISNVPSQFGEISLPIFHDVVVDRYINFIYVDFKKKPVNKLEVGSLP